MMVGSAMLYAMGVIPLTTVHLALAAPLKMPFPLAPSQGLVLMTAAFGRNTNRQVYHALTYSC